MGEIIYQLRELDNGEKKITMATIKEAFGLNRTLESIGTLKFSEDIDQFFANYRMCPPKRRIKYFFSNPLLQLFFIAKDFNFMEVPIDDLTLNGKNPNFQYIEYSDGTKIKFKPLEYINYVDTK